MNVHLSSAGNLTFGVQKDANGSNWHFAQIMSIIYSNAPDLTSLKATRDALVSEAEGLLSGSASYLTAAQQQSLQDAIDAGNAASDFDALNTVTLTTLPNAINTAKQQIQLVKDNRVLMLAALERFENDYNLTDGTDYRRQTMSADAWATLINKVNAVSTALDDVSQATNYGGIKDELVAQMDATDASLRLFKSYTAMSAGTRSFSVGGSVVGGSASDSEIDTDATEQASIATLNTAFTGYVFGQTEAFSANAFLGDNLDFNAAAGATLNNDNSNTIKVVTGWEIAYTDADAWTVIQTDQADNAGKLYMRKNWGSAATTLTASKQKMLPAGRYQLSLSWNSDMENMTNLSQYKLGETTVAIGKVTSGAEILTYEFTVAEPTPFDLVIGFQKTGTGNTPAQLVVDDVTLTCLPPLTFADGSLPTYTAGTYPHVKVSRTLEKDRWYTAVYPFAVAKTDKLDVATLSSFDSASGVLDFTLADASMPNVPFLMRSKTRLSEICQSGAAVAEATVATATAGDASLIGTYEQTDITNAEHNYVLSNNTIYSVGSAGATIPVYRAYIQIAQNAVGARSLSFSVDGESTGIEGIGVVSSPSSRLYNLSGQRVEVPAKGVFIRNGKKVVIR